MGMVAILDMWPGSSEQHFVHSSQGGSTWNLIDWHCDFLEDVWKFENVDDKEI